LKSLLLKQAFCFSAFGKLAGWRKAPNSQGSLAITLISNWNP